MTDDILTYQIEFKFKPEFEDSYNFPTSPTAMIVYVKADSEAHAAVGAMQQVGWITNNANEWHFVSCVVFVP